MIRPAVLALLACPAAVHAACGTETFVACDVGNGKTLEVCIEPGDFAGDGGFTYSFGPAGAPELTLSARMAEFPVRPWPGIGRAIWSAVEFHNAGITYSVWHSFDRLTENAAMEGGVDVLRGEELLASFACRPGGTIAPAFALEDAMAGAGFCWNATTHAWQRGGCG